MEERIKKKVTVNLRNMIAEMLEKERKKMYTDITLLLMEITSSNLKKENESQQQLRKISMIRNSLGEEYSLPILEKYNNKKGQHIKEVDLEDENQFTMQESTEDEEAILESPNREKQSNTGAIPKDRGSGKASKKGRNKKKDQLRSTH
jgi:aspartokinase